MSHLPDLVTDLALILVAAGVVTLVFKWLKQPLVLGYIVAGFLAGPHVTFMPTVGDTANIQTWADIGVIFLLFALGLDFSFKKLMKVGGPAVIAAVTIIFGMVALGSSVGLLLGWQKMSCIFLGGMLAMSSTSIIYKALEDMGLQSRKFAGLVLGILVIEDIVAVVLMVLLSTMAVSHNFEGTEMMFSIGKLMFFLLAWFIIGIYVIPTFFRRTRLLMNDETLLVVSLGLCFLMVVLATGAGFSSALGAFVMGSILAETMEAEKIEHVVRPVKNLFAAVFFVSVGMMVDPTMIVRYWGPILLITVAVLAGQSLFGTFGVLLSGQPLKIAMQCGFCLTQIGEFAFIIASLGMSLRVTDDFLYPVVVAVAVITTFLTPYMIRLAEPAYAFVNKRLPGRWKRFLSRYASGARTVNHESHWRHLVASLVRIVLLYSVVIVAELILAFSLLVPFVRAHLPGTWGAVVSAVVIVVGMSPFLRAIVAKKNHSVEFQALWNDNRFNRGYLVSLIVFRFVIAVFFVTLVIAGLFRVSIALLIAIAALTVGAMFYSRRLKRESIRIERHFIRNFNTRGDGTAGRPRFAGPLLSRDIHLSDFEVPAGSVWIGNTLSELALGTKYGVHVVAVFRGERWINIPGGKERIYPGDRLQVIGTDEQLVGFGHRLAAETVSVAEADRTQSGVELRQIIVDAGSELLGKSLRESGIRDKYKCLAVGLDRGGASLRNPTADTVFGEGDVLWVVGEERHILELINGRAETAGSLSEAKA